MIWFVGINGILHVAIIVFYMQIVKCLCKGFLINTNLAFMLTSSCSKWP